MTLKNYIDSNYAGRLTFPAHMMPTFANSHDIIVLSPDSMDKLLKVQDFRQSIPEALKRLWKILKNTMELSASYWASVKDIRTVSLLAKELGAGTKAYIKLYGGKAYIILKGNPRLRATLNAPRYGVNNMKVITMGLGIAGAINATKKGGYLTIILLSAFRIADYVLRDEATLGQLIGSLATDVVKVGIAVGASIFVASSSTVAAIAIGPIVAVIVVGIAISWSLSQIDEKYGFTKKLNNAIDEFLKDPRKELSESIFKVKMNESKKIPFEFFLNP